MKKITKFFSVLLVLALAFSVNVPAATAAKKAVTNAGTNFYKDAQVKKGAVVFENDFESKSGNYLDGSNSYNYATMKASEDVAHSGKESVIVGSRKLGDAGVGVRISAVNGLNIKTLVGSTVKYTAWVYFKDGEYSKAPSKINFVIWNRENKIGLNKDGTNKYKQVLKKSVKKGKWTKLEVQFKIVDETDNAILLIGTAGEKLNDAGYLSGYYVDDVKLEVVSVVK